jgi:Zn-dependent peptidase ImmA (M78 family)
VPDKIEVEANRLAADLVMPRQLVETKLAEDFAGIVTDATIESLASSFDVSKAAMEIRLSNLSNS